MNQPSRSLAPPPNPEERVRVAPEAAGIPNDTDSPNDVGKPGDPGKPGDAGLPRHVTAGEYCRLALSRRKLVLDRCGTRSRLTDEDTGESYWVEESKLWALGRLTVVLACLLLA